MTSLPFGWFVYGVPTSKGVRVTASRHARDATFSHEWLGGFDGADRTTFSTKVTKAEIIEADSLREALEELYRRWAPTPEGDVHH